ncbi:DUF6266 family protein [Chitinophaga filiformis]|uniref:Uncharacterized protein n=1 Tax=Chitinophaga filiformis TaxID=104663 RepID=A0A1G7MGR5_CHIFI|nr:DUF6266 family protein [Chitinophaga filiformis]SDF60873.1 hypothetical protein SAMN04488121_102419 [Chitinophaga filiformis]
MGKYFKGILGPFSGLVGTVVGAVWNGIYVMRSRPIKSNKPSTDAQLNTQFRLALVTGFLKRIKFLVNKGYQQFNDGITPMNAATAYHLKNAVTGTSVLNYAIDYEKVVFSQGNLLLAANAQATIATAARVNFSWTNDAPMDSTGGTDRATFLVYNLEKDKFVTLVGPVARSAEAYVLQVPPDFSGDAVHCWISFVSSDGKDVSNSVYVGEFTIL